MHADVPLRHFPLTNCWWVVNNFYFCGACAQLCKKMFFSVGEHFVEWNCKEQKTKQWPDNVASSYCTC